MLACPPIRVMNEVWLGLGGIQGPEQDPNRPNEGQTCNTQQIGGFVQHFLLRILTLDHPDPNPKDNPNQTLYQD